MDNGKTPSEAQKILLEFEDGEQVDVKTLDQEDYEEFLERMNALIRSYYAVMDAKQKKQNEKSERNSE